VDGAKKAAQELVEGWLAELKASGRAIPVEPPGFVGYIDVAEDALHSA
jgi:hypothetical protein